MVKKRGDKIRLHCVAGGGTNYQYYWYKSTSLAMGSHSIIVSILCNWLFLLYLLAEYGSTIFKRYPILALYSVELLHISSATFIASIVPIYIMDQHYISYLHFSVRVMSIYSRLATPTLI